jgi:Na+/phosphate symporter
LGPPCDGRLAIPQPVGLQFGIHSHICSVAYPVLEGLADFHKRIIDNLRLAFNVFINDNVKIARTQLRTAELACADSHLARLREGRAT